MKIVINGTFWDKPTTGSGQYLRALLPALKRRAPENAYALISPKAGGGNLAKLWFEQVVFMHACRREHADITHVPYFASPFFSPTRTVVTIHDLIPLRLPAYRGSLLVRAYTRLVAASARRANAIIADSECSQHDIVNHLGIDAARVHVVYLAADARYRPVDDTVVRAKYALPEKYLLYLGGFDQRKNVRVIIEAFTHLPEFHARGYRLALAGVRLGEDSAFFPSPQRIARQVGLPKEAIQYIGWVDEDDKPALYSGATAFLFPSLYEGFGLPPLEAMACGAPVVCSNASAMPEVVGDAALQVDPHDVSAWADAIHAVLTDAARRAAIRERGIAQSKKFSWDRAADETLAVYESVAR